MDVVTYSSFRGNLKSFMRKTRDDAEPILVTNSNPDDNVVVMSVRDYDSLMETARIYSNPQLLAKLMRGMEQAEAGRTAVHGLADDD